jgi:UDP-N-acetylglucosamine 2-epimerase
MEFDVKDVSIWSDPIFDQAKQLLQNMEDITNCTSNNNNFMDTNATMKILTFKMKNLMDATSSKAKNNRC